MRLGKPALALAVALTCAGLASAQESGNWFTRWFTAPPEKIEPVKKVDVKTETLSIPATSANNRLLQAKADLIRRQEVCLKLREVAIANGDDDLLRKAEMLDQRAYDLYTASKNGRPERAAAAEPATKKGDR